MELTDLVFPQYIPAIRLANDDKLEGGYDFKNSNDNRREYYFGDVIDVDISQYLEYYSPGQEGLSDKIVTFPNGYGIRLWFKIADDSSQILFQARWYDENNEQYGGALWQWGYFLSTLDAIPGFTVQLYMSTTYYPETEYTQDPPTALTFFVLGYSYLPRSYISPLVGKGQLNSGEYIQYTARNDLNVNNVSILIVDILHYGSIEDFSTWLHGRGVPFTGDIVVDKDPAGTDDESGTGGGGGDYGGGGGNADDPWVKNSDPIDFPDLPTGGAISCGAIKAFLVSEQTLTALFNKLWNTSIFDIATWQKLFDEPMQSIISLHCIPLIPTTGASANILVGSFDTEIQAPVITNQYVTIDCGSISVKPFWGSALDYSPYTRCEIYLPFIGIKDIATEDVQGQTIHIKYNVDILTGNCTCNIKCGKSCLYKFTGNMRMQVPLSSRSTDLWAKGAGATAGIAGAAAVVAATGGAATPIIGATIAGAGSVASSKVRTQRSGNYEGAIGLLEDFRPFFIFHRPAQSLAKNYNKFKGYPCNITYQLSSLSGYTEVEHIHLTGINGATDTELNEIEKLLKSGVII